MGTGTRGVMGGGSEEGGSFGRLKALLRGFLGLGLGRNNGDNSVGVYHPLGLQGLGRIQGG